MKQIFLDVLKWGLIIIIAGAVYCGIDRIPFMGETQKPGHENTSRYYMVSAGQGVAYKLDRQTGEVWMVIPTEIRPLGGKHEKDEMKEQKDEAWEAAVDYYFKWKRRKDGYKSLKEMENNYCQSLESEGAADIAIQKILEMMRRVDADFKLKKQQNSERYLSEIGWPGRHKDVFDLLFLEELEELEDRKNKIQK